MSFAVKVAYDILDMQSRIDYLEAENDRLRLVEAEHHKFVAESLQHGERMMVGWLDLLTSDKVIIKESTV